LLSRGGRMDRALPLHQGRLIPGNSLRGSKK
jgi:hypothetical protein